MKCDHITFTDGGYRQVPCERQARFVAKDYRPYDLLKDGCFCQYHIGSIRRKGLFEIERIQEPQQ